MVFPDLNFLFMSKMGTDVVEACMKKEKKKQTFCGRIETRRDVRNRITSVGD